MTLTHLSLCTGIGGIDLAAEWAWFTTVGQCEIDEYASKVLAKNFKGVPNLHDIRTVDNTRLREYGIDPDAITLMSAGFPCQPYSLAGKGLGDGDERDLWGEVKRCIGEIKPRWFVGENTPGLFARANQRYFKRILADLAEMGYSVSWGIWGACDVGAPHKRERVFIVAYADGKRRRVFTTEQQIFGERVDKTSHETSARAGGICRNIPDATCKRCNTNEIQRGESSKSCRATGNEKVYCSRMQSKRVCRVLSDPASRGTNNRVRAQANAGGEWWQTEPDVGRVVNGVPARVDRLRCLGNAVVPQQIYPLLQAIADYEQGE